MNSRLIALLIAASLSVPASAQMVPIERAPAATTAVPTPPVVPSTIAPPLSMPTEVPAAPVAIPTLSPAQASWLTAWLSGGRDQGLSVDNDVIGSVASTPSGDALVRATLDRARALRTGRIDSTDFLEVWALRPVIWDPLPSFAAAVSADRLPQWAATLTPRYSGYEGLKAGLATYETIRDTGGWKILAAKSDAAAIRARLALEDKSVTAAEPLVDALQRAQRRYGLNPTGLLDTRTLAELNVPVDERIGSIMANMERWRWLPRELPVNRVQVNIAAAVLTVFEGDSPVASMRAVTGSPTNQTPMLSSAIHSIVINPPWNVPTSIAKRELWPKGRARLIAQGYKIVGTPEGGERIIQPAGPGSALGQLKFDFDNPFAVYLHDTPSRAKFSSFDRLASHGCVRLEKPIPLAELLLKDDPAKSGQVQTLIDTAMTLNAMRPDLIVVRHHAAGAVQLLARKVDCSVINAGDGAHEHPTQALLDALTIRRNKGQIRGLIVAICGDILHSRVARSNLILLNALGAEVRVVGPSTLLPSGLERMGCKVFTSMREGLKDADIVMMLRLQRERMNGSFVPSVKEYFHYYGLDSEKLAYAKPDALVMHPGPMNRGVEIASDIADGAQSLIREQVEMGVAVRMAILEALAAHLPNGG
jgi:aspartate carbamoyltransferase